MFLPCDLREWLPADHLVHFLLDAVEQIPTGHFHINHRGTGSEQYPPTLLLALLIYCYATGRFGSRTIEAATHSDVAVRYLCANHHPDHDSIGVFRTANRAAFQAAFVTVLQLAQQLRRTRVGTVSVDGTKVQANASKHAAVSYQRAGELIGQLQLEVQELVTRAKELAAAQQVEHQAKVAARQAQRAAGKKPRGPEPQPPSETPDPKAQYNFTDPESRIMKAGNGQHFEQAYNAQAAVNEVMLIVGQRVSAAPNDKQELVATVAAISPVVAGDIHAVLVDSGFYSAAAVQAVEQKPDGTPRGLTVYAAVAKQTHHQSVADLLPQPEPAPLATDASPKEKMVHRLQTSGGKQLYKLRKQTVEPVFGIIKSVLGFRQFLLRGREKVSLAWLLICVSYNFKRLFTLKNLAATG